MCQVKLGCFFEAFARFI